MENITKVLDMLGEDYELIEKVIDACYENDKITWKQWEELSSAYLGA